jgi:hypothetical protein
MAEWSTVQNGTFGKLDGHIFYKSVPLPKTDVLFYDFLVEAFYIVGIYTNIK